MTRRSFFGYRLVWVAMVVVVVWLIGGGLPFLLFCDMETRGLFGESFGAVNSLFSGLALAGVVITIALQREDLEMQRRELESNREELKRTAAAQELSQQILARQLELQGRTTRLQALTALVTHRSATSGQNVYMDDLLKARGRDAESYAAEIEKVLGEISLEK